MHKISWFGRILEKILISAYKVDSNIYYRIDLKNKQKTKKNETV